MFQTLPTPLSAGRVTCATSGEVESEYHKDLDDSKSNKQLILSPLFSVSYVLDLLSSESLCYSKESTSHK